jgi:hypothetical protein
MPNIITNILTSRFPKPYFFQKGKYMSIFKSIPYPKLLII